MKSTLCLSGLHVGGAGSQGPLKLKAAIRMEAISMDMMTLTRQNIV